MVRNILVRLTCVQEIYADLYTLSNRLVFDFVLSRGWGGHRCSIGRRGVWVKDPQFLSPIIVLSRDRVSSSTKMICCHVPRVSYVQNLAFVVRSKSYFSRFNGHGRYLSIRQGIKNAAQLVERTGSEPRPRQPAPRNSTSRKSGTAPLLIIFLQVTPWTC